MKESLYQIAYVQGDDAQPAHSAAGAAEKCILQCHEQLEKDIDAITKRYNVSYITSHGYHWYVVLS